MKVITVTNQKGGVGKSSTACALAQAASISGKKALIIELDPQGNLAFFLGVDTQHGGAYELLTGEAPAADLIQRSPTGPDVIPASWGLQTITTGFSGSARRLAAALEGISSRYDVIIIDTPAAAGELQLNALMAADTVLIPLQPDSVAVQGLVQMAETVNQICQNGHKVAIAGCFLGKLDHITARTVLARQMIDLIKETAANLGISFLGAVRHAVAVQEAQAFQQNLFEYAPKSAPAIDYMQIYSEVFKPQKRKRGKNLS